MSDRCHKIYTENEVIIRCCHVCGQISESEIELQKCPKCQKSFLPLNYFHKIHDHQTKYEDLFSYSNELDEEDLIVGIFVLW